MCVFLCVGLSVFGDMFVCCDADKDDDQDQDVYIRVIDKSLD